MNANFAIVLLAIACSGYFSILVFWKSRYLALKSDPQRLIYISSAVGMLSMVLGFPVYSLLRSLLGVGAAAQFLDRLSATYPFPYIGHFCFSCLLGPLCACFLNVLLWAKEYRKPLLSTKSESELKLPRLTFAAAGEQILSKSLEKIDDSIALLVIKANRSGKLIQVNLKSRKVYVGEPIERPISVWRTMTHLRILPKFSGARDKDSLKWTDDRTDYPAFAKYRLSARLEVIGSMKIEAHLLEEKTKIEESLVELEFIDLEDWIKIIPVSEIETISLFDEAAYGKWFSVSSSPASLT